MMTTSRPNEAILDGDIIVYQTAFWAETHDPAKIPKKVGELVKKWTPKYCNYYQLALSCSRSENFRTDIWPAYKENRADMYRPEYLSDVRDFLNQEYPVIEKSCMEADDVMGIYAEEAIAVTIDKDLLGVKGWHYNPNKDEDVRYIDEEEADYFFYKQWMTGDSTDGIPGLWKIGPKKAEKFLNKWEKEEWDDNILEMYDTDKHRPRKDCDLQHPDLALAMARCVKILDSSSYCHDTSEITLFTPKSG